MKCYQERLFDLKQRIWWSGDYNFTSPAPLEDIMKFENKFNVQLPEEYRWFVTNITNGIIAEREWDFDLLISHNWANYSFKGDEHNPSIPFPLNRRVVFSDPLDENTNYPYETYYDVDDDFSVYRNGEISLMGSG